MFIKRLCIFIYFLVDYDCSPTIPKGEETKICKSTKPLPSYTVMKSTAELPVSEVVVERPIINRKQMDQTDKNMTGKSRKKKVIVIESILEPYWPGGEWVYGRTIRPYKRLRTTVGLPTSTLVSGEVTTTVAPSITTPMPNTTTAYVNYQCQQPCSNIFENYGLVCAQRFNGIAYEYREFEDICHMIDSNCMHHGTKRPVGPTDPANYRGPWYVILRGPCHMIYTTFALAETNATKIVKKLEQYQTLDFEFYRTKGWK